MLSAAQLARELRVDVDGALDALLPVAEVQALVLRVRVGVGVLHADEQRGHAAELLGEGLDEGDRAAAADAPPPAGRSPSRARGRRPGRPGGSSPCTTSPPPDPRRRVTSRPQGTLAFRAATSFACTSAGSRSGTMRMPTRAQALSQTMLRASLRLRRLDRVDRERGLTPVGLPRVAPAAEELHAGQEPGLTTEGVVPGQRGDASAARRAVSGFTFSTMPGMAIVPSALVSEASILRRAPSPDPGSDRPTCPSAATA